MLYHPPQVDWGDVRPGDMLSGEGDTYLVVAVEHISEMEEDWTSQMLLIEICAIIFQAGCGSTRMQTWTSLIDEPFGESVVLIRRGE